MMQKSMWQRNMWTEDGGGSQNVPVQAARCISSSKDGGITAVRAIFRAMHCNLASKEEGQGVRRCGVFQTHEHLRQGTRPCFRVVLGEEGNGMQRRMGIAEMKMAKRTVRRRTEGFMCVPVCICGFCICMDRRGVKWGRVCVINAGAARKVQRMPGYEQQQ